MFGDLLHSIFETAFGGERSVFPATHQGNLPSHIFAYCLHRHEQGRQQIRAWGLLRIAREVMQEESLGGREGDTQNQSIAGAYFLYQAFGVNIMAPMIASFADEQQYPSIVLRPVFQQLDRVAYG